MKKPSFARIAEDRKAREVWLANLDFCPDMAIICALCSYIDKLEDTHTKLSRENLNLSESIRGIHAKASNALGGICDDNQADY